MDPVV